MRLSRYYHFILSALSLFSCSEKEYDSCAVTLRLTLPEDYTELPLEEMKVTLTNRDQGNSYMANFSSDGITVMNVEYGYYTASVHYQTASGLIFSGRLEPLALLPGQNEYTAMIQLSRSQTNALVIKEIYYGGCIGAYGSGYQADQYVTLYNNSDETIYLDGLCLAVVDPASNLESPWMRETDMSRIPINDLTWQFPGNGKQYPLAPSAETTIATNAVDHTGGDYQHDNSVNLSKVDWGFWNVTLKRQTITPGVKPLNLLLNLNPSLIMYSFPPKGPAFMVFGIQGIPAETYVNDPTNRAPRPLSSNNNKTYLMIPKQWVIDCVECVENTKQLAFKRVPNDLDNGVAYIPNSPFTGQSLIRKSKVDETGRIIYQDTNNSTEDLIVSSPSLKNR